MIEIVYWYWWVMAVALLSIEILAPGFFFLWMAAAAFITGCILLLFSTLSVEMQLLLFSVLSVASIVVWRMYIGKHPIETDHPLLNKKGTQYIGRVFSLTAPIQNGQGKLEVDGFIWKVKGEDCGINDKVKVMAVKGTVLRVEKALR